MLPCAKLTVPPPGSVAESVPFKGTFSFVVNVVVPSTGLLDPPPPPPPHDATLASIETARTPRRIRPNRVVGTISLPDETECDTATSATIAEHASRNYNICRHKLGPGRCFMPT